MKMVRTIHAPKGFTFDKMTALAPDIALSPNDGSDPADMMGLAFLLQDGSVEIFILDEESQGRLSAALAGSGVVIAKPGDVPPPAMAIPRSVRRHG